MRGLKNQSLEGREILLAFPTDIERYFSLGRRWECRRKFIYCIGNLAFSLFFSSRPARIVNVSSAANSGSDLDIEDLDLNMRRRDRKDEEGKGGFDHLMAYNNSKLAQCLYSNELNRRMDKDGVESCSLHPGQKSRMHVFPKRKRFFFSKILNCVSASSFLFYFFFSRFFFPAFLVELTS